ncbi:MAG: glycosyltransferase family 39 protein [Candidatus Promineifilaceae bacterium]
MTQKPQLKQFLIPSVTTLSVVAMGLVAVYPILFGPALPCTDDAAFHLLRLTQLDSLLQQGIWYSRWAPDMAQGYGFPLFNFYAPLAYYQAEIISLLVGSLYWGLRLTLALGVWGGGLMVYRLTRDHFSHWAALLAAATYMYAPYQGYDIYFRGNLAESMAWPLLPLALWAMGRLARTGGWGWFVSATLTYAAVLLTHNVFALIFSPMLLLYAAAEAYAHCSPSQLGQRLTQMGASLSLALGITAFFWFPAMIEQQYVHIDRLLVPPIFVYWANFLSPAEILALPRAIHPDLLNPSPTRGLGLIPVLLALPAVWGLWHWRHKTERGRQRQVLFFGLALLVYVFLMLPASTYVWEHVPLLPFVQFPWRLLGPAALCLAVLTAAAADVLFRPVTHKGNITHPQNKPITGAVISGHERFLRLMTSSGWDKILWTGGVTILILSSLFWFHPRYCPGLEKPTVADIAPFEEATATIGTTAKGEYLPRTVLQFPPQPAVAPDPFAPETLPEGVQIISQTVEPLSTTVLLEAAAPQTIRVNILYYPGWQLWLDDQPVEITPDPDFGLITFNLPVGRHEVRVILGETPLRRTANGITFLCLLLTGGVAIGSVRQRLGSRRELTLEPPIGHRTNAAALYMPLLLGVLLWAIVQGVLPHWSTWLYRPGLREGSLPEVTTPLPTDFSGGVHLLGYTVNQLAAAPGETIRLDLFWTAYTTPERNLQTTVALVDDQGYFWSAKQSEAPRELRPAPPVTAWQPGQYAQDSHTITILPGTPPGVYTLQLVLFDKQTLIPLAVLANQAPSLVLGQMTVTRPSQSADEGVLAPQYPAEATWGPVRLLGYNLDRAEATPGSPFLLTLFWQAVTPPTTDLLGQLTLAQTGAAPAWQIELPLVSSTWPTSLWQTGDRWRGQQVMRLPASLVGGEYIWSLTVCRPVVDACEPLAAAIPLGSLHLTAPERHYDIPPMALNVEATIGELATLMGVTTLPEQWLPGETVTMELVWRAAAETPLSYHVFLQLLGPAGQVLTQSDGEPANWTRPTTGWSPGEIVVDERSLSLPQVLPPGAYQLVVGLYLPETGQRLALSDGTTAITLSTFTLGE